MAEVAAAGAGQVAGAGPGASPAAAAPVTGVTTTAGKKTGPLVGLTLGGAVLGGLVAAFVIAPRIIARQAPVVGADSTGPGGHAGGAENEGEPAGERRLVELTNIIVNPAGSQGARFLMTTVAFSVREEKAYQVLQDNEVELRDRVTSILESQTMAQLTAPGARDSLKVQIGAIATSLIGPNVPVQVYLPQFVIQ